MNLGIFLTTTLGELIMVGISASQTLTVTLAPETLCTFSILTPRVGGRPGVQ